MFEVVLLAIAVSMDAFAVSIGLGAKASGIRPSLAIKAGLFFGLFQALMPLIGYFAGKGFLPFIEGIDHWIAFLLLGLIGGKMVYESFSEDIEKEINRVTTKVMFVLAIATSIDALAAGFTLSFFNLDPMYSILMIGVTTFFFSVAGVYIGGTAGSYLESKAELLGGMILISIGIKILLEHLGYI